jgi:hypothetical protein
MNAIQKILDAPILRNEENNNFSYDEFIQINADLFKKELSKIEQPILQEKRKIMEQFTKHNIEDRKKEFDTLETFIILCIEVGKKFNHTYRSKAIQEQNLVFDIIVKHHARACRIAQEMLILLKSGFADGAYARWRTLHELNVTAQFIYKHGQECAERYDFYKVIENYSSAKQYKEYEDRLNGRGPTDEELKNLKNLQDKLIKKYGKSFKNSYGWACPFIHNEEKCKSNDKLKITFVDIEKDVNLDHLRPYYKWSSQNIHASPEGLSPRLGLSEATEDIPFVGQSNSRMGLSMHSLALSLGQVTYVFLLMEETKYSHAIMKALSDIKNDIGEMVKN